MTERYVSCNATLFSSFWNSTQSFQYIKQKRAQLAALGEWTHINCLQPGATDRVQDDLLTHLIYAPEATKDVKATASPRSLKDRLLEAADEIMTSGDYLSRDKLPGGAVSFLFERSTKSDADGGQANVDEDA